jgi:glucoamylase
VSSALVGSFAATSSGFAGVSDGHTDLRDGRMDWRYSSAAAGSLVPTAALRGPHTTLALGFAGSAADALTIARRSLREGGDRRAARRGHLRPRLTRPAATAAGCAEP